MDPSNRCGGTNREGEPCRNAAGKGTDHVGYGNCRNHGGGSPNGRKHASKLQAADAVLKFALPRNVDPHTALLEEVHCLAGNVAYLRSVVGEDNLTQTIYTEQGSHEGISVWVELYLRLHDRLVAVCKAAIAAGIEERRVQIAESQASLISTVIRGVLTDLGVADRPEVGQVVGRHLRAVASGVS